MSNAFVILAAGKGTRMKSDMPKVLHQIGHLSMLGHVLKLANDLAPKQTLIIIGHQGEKVALEASKQAPKAQIITQSEQLGTGHAVLQAREALADFNGDVFIVFADTPLLKAETLRQMQEQRQSSGASAVVLGFKAPIGSAYGRLQLNAQSQVERIIEVNDASESERALPFGNSGVMCVEANILRTYLPKITNNNAKGEYYLTDLMGLMRADGLITIMANCTEAEVYGVNSRTDLSAVEAHFQNERREQAMRDGATLIAPQTVFFAHDTQIGRDVVIEPGVIFGPKVIVEDHVTLRAYSHLEGCHIDSHAIIGPYARLRPGTRIEAGAHVGNFVELKNTTLGEGAKANHLSYLGDAVIGDRANIGAGTITCNYDGFGKYQTVIGAEAFIGSQTALVAPLKIGDGAYIASGSVITQNVPSDALAFGRARQENKLERAAQLRALLIKQKSGE